MIGSETKNQDTENDRCWFSGVEHAIENAAHGAVHEQGGEQKHRPDFETNVRKHWECYSW